MKYLQISSLGVLVVLLVSCSSEVSKSLEISGILSKKGFPISGITVRFSSGSLQRQCEVGSDGVTDQKGRFLILTESTQKQQGGFATVVGNYWLCVRQENTWKLLWIMQGGGLVELVKLECDLSLQGPNESCAYSINGHPWVERGSYPALPRNDPVAERKLRELFDGRLE